MVEEVERGMKLQNRLERHIEFIVETYGDFQDAPGYELVTLARYTKEFMDHGNEVGAKIIEALKTNR